MNKQILEKYKDSNDDTIKDTCSNGELQQNNSILDYNDKINFKIEDIVSICTNGNYDMLKHIYSIQPNILLNLEYDNHSAFRSACKNNHNDIVTFLQSINPQYRTIIENNIITDFWMENDINLCIFYDTPGGLEVKTLMNTQQIRIKNINELINKINNIDINEMKDSTYSKHDKTFCDKNIRNSVVSSNFIIEFDNIDVIKQLAWNDKDMIINIHNKFDCIKYSVGGKFDWHRDNQQFSEHNYTFIIYPPQSVIGGEILVKTSSTNKKIKMSDHLWKIVMFPLGTSHCSKEIIKGTKIALKGTAFVREKEKLLSNYYDSGSESEVDCSIRNYNDDDW